MFDDILETMNGTQKTEKVHKDKITTPPINQDVTRPIIDLEDVTTTPINNNINQNYQNYNFNSPVMYGWICPKCGAVMSPTTRCVNCVGVSIPISPINFK